MNIVDVRALGPTTTHRRSMFFRRSGAARLRGALLFVILLSIVPSASFATADPEKFCNRDWEYNLPSIQEAARRIRHAVFRDDPLARADCIRIVLSSPGLSIIDPNCSECAGQFASLLSDSATFTRQAVPKLRTNDNKLAVLRREQVIRERLHDLILNDASNQLVRRYLERNFEEWGDSLESAGLYYGARDTAKTFHDLVLTQESVDWMTKKSIDTWARALRSCPEWNFRSGRDRDKAKLTDTLCKGKEACGEALREVVDGLTKVEIAQSTQAAVRSARRLIEVNSGECKDGP